MDVIVYLVYVYDDYDDDFRSSAFHTKCQQRILGIRWHDLVRNSEVSLRTGLAPVSDLITRGRNATFGHVARLPVNTPAHQAMLRQVELSVGRPHTDTHTRPTALPGPLKCSVNLVRLKDGRHTCNFACGGVSITDSVCRLSRKRPWRGWENTVFLP